VRFIEGQISAMLSPTQGITVSSVPIGYAVDSIYEQLGLGTDRTSRGHKGGRGPNKLRASYEALFTRLFLHEYTEESRWLARVRTGAGSNSNGNVAQAWFARARTLVLVIACRFNVFNDCQD